MAMRVKVGDRVRIVGIDPERRRPSLSMRHAEPAATNAIVEAVPQDGR